MKETWDAKQLVPYITGPYKPTESRCRERAKYEIQSNQAFFLFEYRRRRGISSRQITSNRITWVGLWFGHWTWMTFEVNSVAKGNSRWSKRSKLFYMDSWNCCPRRRSAPRVPLKNIKVGSWIEEDPRVHDANLGLKSQPPSQTQTTEKTTKKPKKSKRDADGPSKHFFRVNIGARNLSQSDFSSARRCLRRTEGWPMARSEWLQELLSLSWRRQPNGVNRNAKFAMQVRSYVYKSRWTHLEWVRFHLKSDSHALLRVLIIRDIICPYSKQYWFSLWRNELMILREES